MQRTWAELKAAADPQILTDLVLANRILYALAWSMPMAHVSARDPKRPDPISFFRAPAPALVKAEDIMAYDLDSRPVADRGCELCSSASSTVKSIGRGGCVCRRAQPFADRDPVQHQQDTARSVYHMASFIPPWCGVRDPRGRRHDRPSCATKTSGRRWPARLNPVALMRPRQCGVGRIEIRGVARAYYTEVNARLQLQARTLEGPLDLPRSAGVGEVQRRQGRQSRACLGHGCGRCRGVKRAGGAAEFPFCRPANADQVSKCLL